MQPSNAARNQADAAVAAVLMKNGGMTEEQAVAEVIRMRSAAQPYEYDQAWRERHRVSTLQAVDRVLAERAEQDAKWGEQNHDDEWWLAILTEEVGELAQTILHARFGGPKAASFRDELTQVAAVALAWIERDQRRWYEKLDAGPVTP